MENQSFDILEYLNSLYMQKIAPDLNIRSTGGHHNIHDDQNNKTDEKILEINKKRIHIPDARIQRFSYQRGDLEEYNEPETTGSTKHSPRKNGKRHDKLSDETDRESSDETDQVTQETIEI